MSKSESVWSDCIDPKTKSKSENGVEASHKAILSKAGAPLHVLEELGLEVPHRDYNPENAEEYPTTIHMDGTSVHLFQDVREDMDEDFGNFGAIEDDNDDDVIWTVVDLTDGTVSLKVVGEWQKQRKVPFDEFADDYEPITCETPHGEVPRYGY